MDLTQMALTGASLIIIGMCGWLLTTVNSMEKEVQLISYKLSEAENELHSIQLTDPTHSPDRRGRSLAESPVVAAGDREHTAL